MTSITEFLSTHSVTGFVLPALAYAGLLALSFYFVYLGLRRRRWWWTSLLAPITIVSYVFFPGPTMAVLRGLFVELLGEWGFGLSPIFGLLVFSTVPWLGLAVWVWKYKKGDLYVEYLVSLSHEGFTEVGRPYVPKCEFLEGLVEAEGKSNENVMITGVSGTGKTTLGCYLLGCYFDDRARLAFSYKPWDSTLELPGFDVVSVAENPPSPFSDPDSFTKAYQVAFAEQSTGARAQRAMTILPEAIESSDSWGDLLQCLKERKASIDDPVLEGALEDIISNVRVLLMKNLPESSGWSSWDFESDLIVDFSGLENDQQKNFFSEYLLRSIWNEVEEGSRRDFVLFTDEAHRVLKEWAGRQVGVLDVMAREVRSLGGNLIISTQNRSDISELALNQFDSQFCFRSTSKSDLESLSQIYGGLSSLVRELSTHHFVDVRQYGMNEDVKVYSGKFPEWLVSDEVKPSSSVSETSRKKGVKPAVKRQEDRRETPDKGRETREKERETQKEASGSGSSSGDEAESSDKAVRVDKEGLENDLMRLLNERAYYVSELGRELEDKYDKDANRLKVDCHALLKDLTSSGAVMKADLEDRWGNRLVMYWSKEKGVSAFHKALTRKTKATILEQGGEIEKGRAGSDLTALVNNSEIGIECETGLKSDLEKFKEDVEERVDHFDQVWIITPAKKKRKKYRESLESVKSLRFKTLKTLKSSIRK